MSYRLQILHGSSYGYSEQITKVEKYKNYISTHNSAIFSAKDSRFCMQVHFPQSTKIKLGRGFRDFRPCYISRYKNYVMTSEFGFKLFTTEVTKPVANTKDKSVHDQSLKRELIYPPQFSCSAIIEESDTNTTIVTFGGYFPENLAMSKLSNELTILKV